MIKISKPSIFPLILYLHTAGQFNSTVVLIWVLRMDTSWKTQTYVNKEGFLLLKIAAPPELPHTSPSQSSPASALLSPSKTVRRVRWSCLKHPNTWNSDELKCMHKNIKSHVSKTYTCRQSYIFTRQKHYCPCLMLLTQKISNVSHTLHVEIGFKYTSTIKTHAY